MTSYRPMSFGSRRAALMASLAVLGAPSLTLAQTMNANSAAYNAGYARTAGSENSPVNPSMWDASGNMTVVNGLIQNGASNSVFASAGGVATASSGVGVSSSGSASAIGNSLNVVVQGNYNTVIVNSTQTNSGTVTATTTTNGNP